MAHRRRSWTVKEIRDLVERKLCKRPCWFQIKIALAIFQKKDVVGTAATGSGKTLTFWIALLMALEDGEDVMEFIITPLNILGKQTIQDLEVAGIKSIAVSKENANAQTFKVRQVLLNAGQNRAENQ
jgi:superfamily II DNA/RNA helicase